MRTIKELTDNHNNFCVFVFSFHDDQKLLYMVDNLTNDQSKIFDNKKDAIDYAQAITNRWNRTLSL